MNRLLKGTIVAALIVVAVGGGYYLASAGYGRPATVTVASEPPAVADAAAGAGAAEPMAEPMAETLDGSTIADARVVPVQVADLSAATSGIVAEILVREGDQVGQGDVLLRLDPARQLVGVAQAQAQLQGAQARLADVAAGARPEEVAAAQSTLEGAVARFERLANGALPGQLAQAEAALAASSAQLAKLYEGADESALIAAQADLAGAEAVLTQAQRAYDQVKWRNDIGALPQSAQLQQATIAWEAAKARLDLLTAAPGAADVAAAGADVQRQQASLETVQNSMPGDLAAAQADVAFSQAQLDLLLAGARPEQVAVAEADVAAATAQLQQALVALSETELRAPFSGTIAVMDLTAGELLAQGSTAMTLADLSRWQIETEDLTELDVVGIETGQKAMLGFDALPGVQLEGTVRFVRPQGTDNRGDIVYTVIVEPDALDARLRWNMTAVVTID